MTLLHSEAHFLKVLAENSFSPTLAARALGMSERNTHARISRIRKRGVDVPYPPRAIQPYQKPQWAYHRLRRLQVDQGAVIVYSDAHFYPGVDLSPAFAALLKLCRALKPAMIVANGDLIDGARISRFPGAGWAKTPTMTDELRELQDRQAEIRAAAPRASHYRTIGNHDLRLDRFFAQNAEQFEGLPGTRLSDFLPDWPESYSIQVNDVYIKHRHRGGIHAGWNNVLQAGCSIVTGHLHKLEAKPLRGYRDGRIWGIETGTLSTCPADLSEEGEGPFEYVEDGPTNWASGFAVLTFWKGKLLPPEFCSVEYGKAWFRGQEVK